ncbi:MAG: tRNA pseudouridine(55) synthase TruB, partial [Fuerstiella sp.]
VKVGHAGTLDPMATGVLLVCTGPATRLISRLQAAPKTYVAEFVLGQRSDTDDATGDIEQATLPATLPTEAEIGAALQAFTGPIQQVPPAFSAVKVKGQRAYTKARRGDEFQLKPRTVVVHSIQILNFDWPKLNLRITCGSGTYIRSIARDLGERLGCGGLMSALERTAIGQFSIADATDPNLLTEQNLPQHLTSPAQVVQDLPRYHCSAEIREVIARGNMVVPQPELWAPPNTAPDQLSEDLTDGAEVALVSESGSELLALGQWKRSAGRIQPRTVFVRPRNS